MNTRAAADALNKIAEGVAALALALEQREAGQQPAGTVPSARGAAVQQEGGRGDVPPVPAALPPSLDELPPDESFALPVQDSPGVPTPVARPAVKPGLRFDVCPKHLTEWSQGTYGPYCPSKTDDPAWANNKGWCRIKPSNAAKWVEIQRAGVA